MFSALKPSTRVFPSEPQKRLKAWRLAEAILRPAPKLLPDEWARLHRVYPETSGLPGPRDPWLTPYMVPMARAVHGGAYKRVVMVCAAQSGKSESLLDIMGARLDQRPAPILYVGPIRDFLTDQFEPRLMSLLDEAETLSAKVVRGKRMKKTLKIVAGVPVRLAHAGSSAALKSSPAALALVDEYDEMLANVKGQGDPLGLVEARGETYADFVTAITSTPSRGLAQRLAQEFAPALEAARPVIEWFKSIGGAIGDAWERASAKVGEWFSFFTTQEDLTGREEVSLQFAGYRWADAFINGIKNLPERVMGVLANLKDRFVEAGRNAIHGLWDGMRSMIDSLIAWLSEQVDRIVAPFRGLGAKIRSSLPAWAGGGSATAAPEAPAPAGAANPEGKGDFGGARAEGGPVSRGKSYLVGERGPEIFTPRASGEITPNRAIPMPSLAAHFNITFNGNGGNNVDEIRRVLREEVHKAFRGVYADAGMRFA